MIVYIEDLVRILAKGICPMHSKDEQMIASFDDQNGRGIGLTVKQRSAAIRILRHYESPISKVSGLSIQTILDNPQFQLPLREIRTVKQVSVVPYDGYPRAIKLEFPYDEEKLKSIHQYKEQGGSAQWDGEQKSWIFSLDEENIEFLIRFCGDGEFIFDDEFEQYKNSVVDIVKNIQDYVPMLVLKNSDLKIANKPENLPELESKDVLSAVFEARRKGILTWDETINQHPSMREIQEPVREFLNGDYDHITLIDSQKNSIDCLDSIIKYLSPCLIIIPGGSELEKISQAYDFLTSRGIKNSEISTMFRLPSETGTDFNNFVKNSELNNPITDSTRIVFVSTKLPKSVLKSKIRFNCIINMGTHSAHHTIKEFMKNHENLVIFSEINKLKNIRDRQAWRLHGL
jgi:hypothetical protein